MLLWSCILDESQGKNIFTISIMDKEITDIQIPTEFQSIVSNF